MSNLRRPGLWLSNGAPSNVSEMYRWYPGAVTCFFDYLSANRVAEYKAANPDVSVIVRFQHPQNWQVAPEASASNLAALIVSKWPEIRPLNPYVYFWNEINLHYENGDPNTGNQWQYETPTFYEKVADWTLAVADRIKAYVPDIKLVCPPFAYGHHEDGAPDDNGNPKDGWAGYDYLAPTIVSHFDNIICGHYYWGDGSGGIRPRLYDPIESSWHAFRWRRVLSLFQKRYNIQAKLIIDEAGNFGASDDDFTDQVMHYSRECLMDLRVIALCFFLWEDPTWSPGNIKNSWVQQCQNLSAHVTRLEEMPDVTIPPPALSTLPPVTTDTIRVLKNGSIETLPIEEYLRGVIPAEVFAIWPMDALRAQAVWSRSYAYWRIANPRHASFDLYGDAKDQVWNIARIHPRTDEAVKATAGVILTQDGKPFPARYVSACGREMCLHCQGKNGYDGKTWENRSCQWGAKAMADSGIGWREIAIHYYQDVELSDGG